VVGICVLPLSPLDIEGTSLPVKFCTMQTDAGKTNSLS